MSPCTHDTGLAKIVISELAARINIFEQPYNINSDNLLTFQVIQPRLQPYSLNSSYLAPDCLSLNGNVPALALAPVPPLLESGEMEEFLPDAELLGLRDRVRQLDAGRLLFSVQKSRFLFVI